MIPLSQKAQPNGWLKLPLKWLGTLRSGSGFPHEEQGQLNEELPFFKVKDIANADSSGWMKETDNYISRDTARRLHAEVFPRGTIVFAKVGAALLLNRFRLLAQESCIDNNLMGLIVKDDIIDTRFLLYSLSQIDFGLIANPGAVPSLNESQIGEELLSIPTLPEQRDIAKYLDCIIITIDTLVAAKQRLLDLLTEKRRALITHAVTRGLHVAAPLRDSGVEWLREIPKHWEVEYARWLFREVDERSTTGEEELLTVSHLTGVTLRSEKDVNMFMAESNEGYKICQAGDLVINTLWAWMGAMGVAFQSGIVSPAYNVYRPVKHYDPQYIDHLVRMPTFAQEVTRYSKGVWSSRLRLYPEEFFQVILPVPPLSEQREIADYIESKVSKLDNLYLVTEKTISLLQERRTALIAAAVTGELHSE